MTIKEVEEITNLPRSNIRFYEKEKLITPVRNPNNGYREYSEKDVNTIKKIAYLRTVNTKFRQSQFYAIAFFTFYNDKSFLGFICLLLTCSSLLSCIFSRIDFCSCNIFLTGSLSSSDLNAMVVNILTNAIFYYFFCVDWHTTSNNPPIRTKVSTKSITVICLTNSYT